MMTSNSITSQSPTPSCAWGQINGGPQAMAYKAIMTIMSMMNQVMSMYQNQVEKQAEINCTAAQAAADATVSAAKLQAYATSCDAANSFATAVVGLASAGLSFSQTRGIENEIKNAQTENENLTTWSKDFDSLPKSTQEVGAEDSSETSQDVINRQKDLTRDQHSLAKALENKDEAETTKVAYSRMSDKEVAELKENMRLAQKANSEKQNNLYSKYSSTQQKISMYENIANGFIGGACKTPSAVYSNAAGEKQAEATLTKTISDQASSMLSNSTNNISKAYDEEMQVLQMLASLASAASVRG
jgi:hypothetical protein